MKTISFITDPRCEVADHCKCPNCGSILVECGTELCPSCEEELQWYDNEEQEVYVADFTATNETIQHNP